MCMISWPRLDMPLFRMCLLEKCTDYCGILFAFYFAKFMSSEKNERTIIPLG